MLTWNSNVAFTIVSYSNILHRFQNIRCSLIQIIVRPYIPHTTSSQRLQNHNHMRMLLKCTLIKPNVKILSIKPQKQKLKHGLAKLFFVELIILASWSIWTGSAQYRAPNLYRCMKSFKHELT